MRDIYIGRLQEDLEAQSCRARNKYSNWVKGRVGLQTGEGGSLSHRQSAVLENRLNAS